MKRAVADGVVGADASIDWDKRSNDTKRPKSRTMAASLDPYFLVTSARDLHSKSAILSATKPISEVERETKTHEVSCFMQVGVDPCCHAQRSL